jgi:hypothetical protein
MQTNISHVIQLAIKHGKAQSTRTHEPSMTQTLVTCSRAIHIEKTVTIRSKHGILVVLA